MEMLPEILVELVELVEWKHLIVPMFHVMADMVVVVVLLDKVQVAVVRELQEEMAPVLNKYAADSFAQEIRMDMMVVVVVVVVVLLVHMEAMVVLVSGLPVEMVVAVQQVEHGEMVVQRQHLMVQLQAQK